LACVTPGKRSVALEAFARALRALPGILAENGGLDAAELVAQLRAAHHRGEHSAGLDLQNATIADVRALGIVECCRAKLRVLTSATEAAEMILRVDDIIRSAPRKREADPRMMH